MMRDENLFTDELDAWPTGPLLSGCHKAGRGVKYFHDFKAEFNNNKR